MDGSQASGVGTDHPGRLQPSHALTRKHAREVYVGTRHPDERSERQSHSAARRRAAHRREASGDWNSPASLTLSANQHDDRCRECTLVCQRDPAVSCSHAGGSRRGPAVQLQCRPAAAVPGHLKLAPADAEGVVVLCERLESRLLCSDPRCHMLFGVGLVEAIRTLGIGEQAKQGSVPVTVQQLPHPVDGDDIDADAEDTHCTNSFQSVASQSGGGR